MYIYIYAVVCLFLYTHKSSQIQSLAGYSRVVAQQKLIGESLTWVGSETP